MDDKDGGNHLYKNSYGQFLKTMTKLIILPFLLFQVFQLSSQSFNLSNNLDKLILGETTIKEACQVLGKPTKELKRAILINDKKHNVRTKNDKVLYYDSLNIVLYFDYELKTLASIEINSTSLVRLNDNVRLVNSDTSEVIKSFGKPFESINENGIFGFSYFDNKENELTVFFEENGFVKDIYISTKKFNNREIIQY
ncbi:MAG: hypothetical protein V4511_03525 [Bacteroidota bacterium]